MQKLGLSQLKKCKFGDGCFLQYPDHLLNYHGVVSKTVVPECSKTKCSNGEGCTNLEPNHIKTFHSEKCPFGNNCHRANPGHVKKYHPGKKFSPMYF
jgi:hypothetical protein